MSKLTIKPPLLALCPSLAPLTRFKPMLDPTRYTMLESLRATFAGSIDPDENGLDFDTECAVYWFANDYHSGQGSNLYSALSTSPYKPSSLSRGISNESELAYEMYVFLVRMYNEE